MNYHIITYGCQMNKSDSERIAAVLEKVGYKKSAKIEQADLVVVNMCSVRQSAVDRIFGISQKFAKLKTKNCKLKTVLAGCILKRDRQKFAKIFDLILNIKNLPKWPKYLKPKTSAVLRRSPLLGVSCYLNVKPKYQNNFSVFVPISTGCDNFCTYCVVPYTRGPEISRPAENIIEEVKNALKNGAKEIWLLGQNVNSYGVHRRTDAEQNAELTQKKSIINFAKLLKMVNDIPGNFWIRFTSSHPKDFTDELIEAMAECEKVTPYLNLPVQSGDNKILKKMNRPYTVGQYKKIIKKVRQNIPNITLSTDIIVGFPGETKKQFKNTCKLFREIKYDMAYIARYSPRPGTTAAKMKDDVPQKEKVRRAKALNEILKKTVLAKNKKYVGKIVEVLDEEAKNGFLVGKSREYKTVKSEGPKNLVGSFVKVKIIGATAWGLSGRF